MEKGNNENSENLESIKPDASVELAGVVIKILEVLEVDSISEIIPEIEKIKSPVFKSGKRYKTYFITSTKNGGTYIYTDLDYDLTKNNLFINPKTNMLIINYFFKGEDKFTRCFYDLNFEDISIEEIKES